MSNLNLSALESAPLQTDPFDYVVVPGFLTEQALEVVNDDFPDVPGPGSFNMNDLKIGAAFHKLTDELQSPEMTEVVSRKFDIDLTGRPTIVTIRGHCRETDGRIHRDSKGKIITALLYMNGPWEAEGGRLRLLRDDQDLENYVAEVPPVEGALLMFRCSPNSWHGHKTFVGQRRSIQLNWVRDESYKGRKHRRHKVSALMKKLGLAS